MRVLVIALILYLSALTGVMRTTIMYVSTATLVISAVTLWESNGPSCESAVAVCVHAVTFSVTVVTVLA